MEQVLVAIAVMTMLLVITTGALATIVVRGLRRRYRAVRARLPVGRAAPPDVSNLVRMSGSLGSPGWWLIQNRRHRMWRAVTSAEHAVGVARRTGVAVGDLPGLAKRLHAAANAVDAVLRANGGQGPLREEDRRDCDRIVAAASDLRGAALSSLRVDSHADTETVVSAVQIEVAALAAGVRAAHS